MKKTSADFRELYNREKNKIELRIGKVFRNRKPDSLYNPGKYILNSGGKRLRPLLVLLSAKAAGGKFSDAYNAAVAVELLHNFTLVHDDIMDNADKRRGRVTLHKKYDSSTAILAGDSLLAVAYECLLKDCRQNPVKIFQSFTKALVKVCEGQSLDKDFETRTAVAPEEYIEMISKKTAAMIEMCCELGGLIAGAPNKIVRALALFGRYIGIAFQIQDDLLDITADEKKFGKTSGGDLVEGKKTFLFLRALEKATGADREALLRVIKNKGIKRDDVNKYKMIYRRLGVIDDSVSIIKNYSEKASQQLKYLSKDDKAILHWLNDSLINRIH
ncbi:MAG: polyprenyl synthetase family protein [Ignavibacteriaceae bacterium]